MFANTINNILKPALLSVAVIGLSGCAYGVGGGYADGYYGDGYVNGGYGCDPYDPFDSYYTCDYGYGFANIGFGGGWYDNFYYPGYGLYLFDRGGRRHAMQNKHRRHWAKQRAEHGTRHVRRGEGRRDLTPEQRAERRERREDRRARRDDSGRATGNVVPTGRAAVRQERWNGRNAVRGQNVRQPGTVGISRPTGAAEQAQRGRPAQVARPNRQQAQSRPQPQAQPQAQPRPQPTRAARPQASKPTARPATRAPRPASRTQRRGATQRKID